MIRAPLEACDLAPFWALKPGDMLFLDGSHRCFTNSDVTVFFLDILPHLPSGILIGIHDIYLPYDYPQTWLARGYSEQYLLAVYLLSKGLTCQIEFPTLFLCHDASLQPAMARLWRTLETPVEHRGSAFWFWS